MNKELQNILARLTRSELEKSTVLATVIDVVGSGYRLPGARMLISQSLRDSIGTVSGGCLESDVIERARSVIRTQISEVITYDTRSNIDSVFSLNMGCKGVTRILLETPSQRLVDFLQFHSRERSSAVIVTLIATKTDRPSADAKIGSRLYFDKRGVVFTSFSEDLTQDLAFESSSALISGKSTTYVSAIGEFFIEYIPAIVKLLVFGAGADAVSLAQITNNIGWNTTIVDHRPAFLNSDRFPHADELVLCRPENVGSEVEIDENTAVVVMTHNYEHDLSIVSQVLFSSAFYLGMLGPKRRIENIAEQLNDSSRGIDQEILTRFHSPIGLNIGADNPEMISISIIAEIQTVLKNRRGGFLKDFNGPITDRIRPRDQSLSLIGEQNSKSQDVLVEG